MLDEFDISKHFDEREESRINPSCYEIMNVNLEISPKEFDIDNVKEDLKKELFNQVKEILKKVKKEEDSENKIKSGYAYFPLFLKTPSGKVVPIILRDFCSGRQNDDNYAFVVTTSNNVLTSNYFTNMTKDKYQNKQNVKYPGTVERTNLSHDIIVDLEKVLESELDESVDLQEDYPSNFSMEEFKNIPSYKGRLQYASERLKKLGTGSSRVVFDIDGEKVLKIAKNAKGIAQNETEEALGRDSYLSSLVAKIFDAHPDSQWLEMEKAEKINKNKFKEIVGVDIDKMGYYLRDQFDRNHGRRSPFSLTPEENEEMGNNEFVQDIMDIMFNFDLIPGDLAVPTSYGIVKRDGHDSLVLVDYGVTNSIYDQFYTKKGLREIRLFIRSEVKKLLK